MSERKPSRRANRYTSRRRLEFAEFGHLRSGPFAAYICEAGQPSQSTLIMELPVPIKNALPPLLLKLKNRIEKHFTVSDWTDLGALTGNLSRIEDHSRLFRSMRFGDDDYGSCVLSIINEIVAEDPKQYPVVLGFVDERYPDTAEGQDVSSKIASGRKIVFTPSAFSVPDVELDAKLVSVMMPFAGLDPVYETIQAATIDAGLKCERADNIWDESAVIQDIFSLIFRSFIVVCDFTNKNPNVFYEAGIAHTLGKHVVPITQSLDDIPFDIRHHRFLKYLNNKEGRKALQVELAKRFKTLTKDQSQW